MAPPLTRVLRELTQGSPFIGVAEIERRRGRPYRARLGANECLYGVSPVVAEVMRDSADAAAFYPDPTCRQLRGKLADLWRRPMDELVVGAGIEGLLDLLVRATVEPGEACVTSHGAFIGFDYYVQGVGGRLGYVPYTDTYENDLQGLLEAAHRDAANLVYLANPDSPTGTLLPWAAIQKLVEQLPNDCLLVLDEAYAEFAPDDAILPRSYSHPQLVRLRTFSKAYALAGLRVAYAVADPAIVAALDRVRNHFSVSHLAQAVAARVLDDGPFLARVRGCCAAARADYEQIAAEVGVGVVSSHANFVSLEFPDALGAKRIADELEARDVFVVHPRVAPVDRLVRVTVGTEADRLVLRQALLMICGGGSS